MNSAGLEILQERLKYYASRWQVILFDALMVVVAWFLSYWIYFNLGTIPQKYFDHAVTMLPLVVLCHSAMSIGFAVPRGAWRFTSTHDIYPIVMSVCGGIVVSGFVGFLLTRLEFIPRVLFLVYGVLLIGLLSSCRLLYRSYHTPRLQGGAGKRVLIIGGGVAGNMLVIDLKNSTPLLYKAVGILDDNPRLKGSHIQGIRVLGTCSSLPQLTQGLHIEQVLIAMPSATTARSHCFGYIDRAERVGRA